MEWIIPRQQDFRSLSRDLGLTRTTASILAGRGLSDPDRARAFLSPGLKNLPSPFLLPDMPQAVDRLIQALKNSEPVVVYGDYDADGLTAAALLTDFFQSVGLNVSTYIPHRLEEGYGLNVEAVERIAGSGIKLIVTVDCGVSDHEAVQRAQKLGLDVIVTDHHQPPEALPRALAVVNPQLGGFPQKNLAGVGVAFFLAGALRQTLRERSEFDRRSQPELAPFLSLTAIGTVADVMPLTKVNRILVSAGLNRLASPDKPGLTALKKAGDLKDGLPPTAREVAFRLAPRLNAVGRLDSARPGLELLLTSDKARAEELAETLDQANRERKHIQEKLIREAMAMAEEAAAGFSRSLVLAREEWPRGVVGLAASRLAEKLGRPTILLALEDGLARGSGRSIPGFNLFRALDQCRDLMLRFGGHEQAAGLTMEAGQVPKLAREFEAAATRELDRETGPPPLTIDAMVGLDELDMKLFDELELMEPCGQGNPEPVLGLTGLNVISAGTVGKGHLKLTLGQNGSSLSTIGFNLGPLLPELGRRVDVAVKRHKDIYRGEVNRGWQLVDAVKHKSRGG